MHSKHIPDSDKLVYFCQALQVGASSHVIEGLSSSGNEYQEGIDCLRDRYDKPCLLHRIHVLEIIGAPALKDGSGKELRCLHDNLNQYLRVLRAMNYEPYGPFVTALIEEKLDKTTMFEWQRYSQESPNVHVPHFKDLLTF